MSFKKIQDTEKMQLIKILYCPICGRITTQLPETIGTDKESYTCSFCYKSKYQSIEENYMDLYDPNEEYNLMGTNERIIEYVRQKYVRFGSMIKVFYCSVCGDIVTQPPSHVPFYQEGDSCHECHKGKYKSIKENYTDLFDSDEEYNLAYHSAHLNKRIEDFIREKYVLIDSNKEFNKRKYKARERYEEKVAAGYYPTKTQPSSQTNKSASVVGRAVVGGAIAGPTGAVVGAISAVNKNIQNKK